MVQQHDGEIHLTLGHEKSGDLRPSNRGSRVWLVATIATSIALIVGAAAGVLFSQLVLSPSAGCNIAADEQVGGSLGRNDAMTAAVSGVSDTWQQNGSGSGAQAFASPMRLTKAGQCLEASRLPDDDTRESQNLALHLGKCSSTNPSQLWGMDIYGRIRSTDVQSYCIVFNGNLGGDSGRSEGDSSESDSSEDGRSERVSSSEASSNFVGVAVKLEECASAELTGGQWMQTSGGHIRLREKPEWCLDANPADNGAAGIRITPCVHDSTGQLFTTEFPVEGPDVPGPTPAPTMPGPSSAPEGFNFYLGKSCETASIEAATLPSAEACGEMCFADPECNAYSYKTRNQRCYTKKDCDEWEEDEIFVSGIKPFYDIEGGGAGELICTDPDDEEICDSDSLDGDEQECPVWSEKKEESSDPLPDEASSEFVSPYQDIIDGGKEFITTYPENRAWPTCPFRAPTGPRSTGWVDECIENARAVGFLNTDALKRPNSECPTGWFLCKGMCYTIAQRHSVGPSTVERGEHHASDYMNIEARCGLCGGARVAFVGDDPEMEKVAAEAAAQTINGDKALYARRFRFLEKPNPRVEDGEPFQAWYRYVELNEHDRRDSTYQRYYTGEKDGLSAPGWDQEYRNQEASILCVNTIDRIHAAARIVESRLTMEGGCLGDDLFNRWDNHHHRWFPEHNWPYPGL